MGIAYRGQEDRDRPVGEARKLAQSAFARALEIDPEYAPASLSRTFGRFEKSIDLAKKSISYDPVDSSAYANLGYSYYYAGRLDEAAAAFRRAISLNPENFRSYVYLGRVLLAQGAVEEAFGVIQKASWYPYRLAGLAMAYHSDRRGPCVQRRG